MKDYTEAQISSTEDNSYEPENISTEKELKVVDVPKTDDKDAKATEDGSGGVGKPKAHLAGAKTYETELRGMLDGLKNKREFIDGMVKELALLKQVTDPQMPIFQAPERLADKATKQALDDYDRNKPEAPILQDTTPDDKQAFIGMALTALGSLGNALGGGSKYGIQSGTEVAGASMSAMVANSKMREKQNALAVATYSKAMETWQTGKTEIYKKYIDGLSDLDKTMLTQASNRWEKEFSQRINANVKLAKELYDQRKLPLEVLQTAVKDAKNVNDIRKANMQALNKSEALAFSAMQ